jgi:hypothetical protein
VPDFGALDSLMLQLHSEFVQIYYLMLPVAFVLAIALNWFRFPGGGPDFLDTLRRTIISTLLLAALPEISQAILFVADGIAERIDQARGLDAFMRLAQERSEGTTKTNSILLSVPNLILNTLAFASYLLLYIARYLTIAMYHFYWLFYMVTSPLLLILNLFPATSQVTGNLFRSLIEISCWKIAWSILGAMLIATGFGEKYQSIDNYITLFVMNVVIAYSMLKTPSLVKSLASSGAQGMAGEIGSAAGTMIAATMPAKGALAAKKGWRGAKLAHGKIQNYRENQRQLQAERRKRLQM